MEGKETLSSGEGVNGSFGMMGLCLGRVWTGGEEAEEMNWYPVCHCKVLGAGRRVGAGPGNEPQICSAAFPLKPTPQCTMPQA